MEVWACGDRCAKVWYPMVPVPTIKIIAVLEDGGVTFETSDFPEDEDFTVTMGYMYTRGVNGIEVGTFNSGDGGAFQQSFRIPQGSVWPVQNFHPCPDGSHFPLLQPTTGSIITARLAEVTPVDERLMEPERRLRKPMRAPKLRLRKHRPPS